MAKLKGIRRRRTRPAETPEPDVVTYDENGAPILPSQRRTHTADFVIDTPEGSTIGFGELNDEQGQALSDERTKRALALAGFGENAES